MAIINGTALDDVLATSLALDTVNGLAGNDWFFVAAPAELVVGDKVDGGLGYDRLWFTSTNASDTLFLAALAPVKLFVAGIEAVEIVDGTGSVAGTTALNLTAVGLTTGLILAGNDGINSITGSAGADSIIGNGGLDTLFGGLGNDRIAASAAQNGASDDMDQINVGAINATDTLVLLGPVSADPLVTDDRVIVDLTVSTASDQVTVFSSTGPGTISGALAGLVQTGFANVDATGLVAAALWVTASAPVNTLLGGVGNDFFIYNSSTHLTTDLVNGGPGIDTLRFASTVAAGQTLLLTPTVFVEAIEIATTGALGVAVTTGTEAHKVNALAVKNAVALTGNDGKNTLTGTKFADTINGNGGIDSLAGGEGNDLYVVDDAADWTIDAIYDSKGIDNLVFTNASAQTLVLGPNIKGVEAVWISDTAFGVAGTSNVNLNGSALGTGMSFVGNSGNNLLTGGKFNDKLNGNAGVDTIIGGLGNDMVSWDAGTQADEINAGLATEGNTLVLTGTAVADVFVNLSLDTPGADQMAGLAGTQAGFSHVDASTMTGAGHLEVRGSLQKNLLTGSGGDDIFDFFLPAHLGTSDRIDGGGGNDTLRFSSTNSMVGFNTLVLSDLELKRVENVDIFDTNGAVIGTTALNITATAVSTSKLHYFGNDGNNKISTGITDDTLNGNGGIDTLSAGGGNDVIQVDSGADHVTGLTAATSDSIDGGLGDDELWFVSEVDNDVLTLNAGIKNIEKIRLTNDKGDPETFSNIGVDASLAPAVNILGNDGANLITGSAKADRIDGGKGADTIIGGLGNDTILATAGIGNEDQLNAAVGGVATATDKNLLMPAGEWDGLDFLYIDLSNVADQLPLTAGTQTGFWNVDASQFQVDAFGAGVYVVGNGNHAETFVGSREYDAFEGGAGADTINGGGKGDDYIVRSSTDWGADVYNDTGGTVGDWLVFEYAGYNGSYTFTTAVMTRLAGIDGASVGFSAGGMDIDAHLVERSFSLSGNQLDNTLTGTRFGESIFDYGGTDLMKGGDGSDDYVIISQWVAGPGGDQIIDLGPTGYDELYYANPLGDSSDILVVNSNITGIERFIVSSGGLNIDGPNPPSPERNYIRDIRFGPDSGIDLSAYGVVGQSYHLAGSYGDNQLTGTKFNDTIIGWQGADTIVGGLGTDWIYVGASDDNVDAVNAGLRGEQNHLLLHDTMPGIMVVDLSSDVDQITVVNRFIDDDVFVGEITEGLLQTGFMHVDASLVIKPEGFYAGRDLGVIIIGSAGVNSMVGSNFDDAFVELSAADFAIGESITGGTGNDVLRFNPSVLVLGLPQTLTLVPGRIGGVEAAEISDEYGGDTTVAGIAANLNASAMLSGMALGGNSGDNLITGTASADTITGNGGADTLVGGAGNDLYVVKDGLHLVAGDAVNDAAGTLDTLRFASSVVLAGPSQTAVLTAQMVGLEAVEITDAEGHPEGDTSIPVPPMDLNLDASAVLNGLVMRGNDALNIITGSGFADTIDGFRGTDTINAGGGADRIIVELEDDPLLLPMDGFDQVDGGAIAEGNMLVLQGKLVNDTAPSGAMTWDLSDGVNQFGGVEVVTDITSLDFSDLLNASVTVSGSADGNDLTGTALDDTFITATEFVAGDKIDGGLGNDTLRFTSGNNGDELLVNGDITDIEFVELAGSADLMVNASAAVNALKITGNTGANSILGGTGNDTIAVDIALDDTVVGGSGTDTLVLAGAAAGAITVNLALVGDQITGIAGNQSGFESLDASGVTGFDVTITGTAAANTIGLNVASASVADAGAATEGNTLLLGGAAAGAVVVDLSLAGDQVTSMTGNQSGFQHVDASTMTGFGLNLTGSAAANNITGSVLADTIAGGGGADVITLDLSGAVDLIDAGGFGEGNKLVLKGDATAAFNVDLEVAADQLLDEAGVQTGFQHVNASAMGAFGINVRGNGLNNQLTGTMFADTLTGLAGADTFVLGGGKEGDDAVDRVVYERPGDGANSLAVATGYDRVLDFEGGVDKIVFTGQLNSGAANLDDSFNNDTFAFSLDGKANFSGEHEAMFISADKSLLRTELQLATLATVATIINDAKRGVIAATGDDGLILIQASNGTGDAAVDRTGIYYYQEMDGILNKVSAGELILLGVVEGKISNSDVLLV